MTLKQKDENFIYWEILADLRIRVCQNLSLFHLQKLEEKMTTIFLKPFSVSYLPFLTLIFKIVFPLISSSKNLSPMKFLKFFTTWHSLWQCCLIRIILIWVICGNTTDSPLITYIRGQQTTAFYSLFCLKQLGNKEEYFVICKNDMKFEV